jgi:beta-mannosidase
VLKNISLAGPWQFAAQRWLEPPQHFGFSKLDWLPARVPGHVHLDLLENNVISDPFAALHELGARFVDEEDWVYRTEFDFVSDPRLPRAVLSFGGLDTIAAIELNGAPLAEHANMFVPLAVDVTERLQSGRNELTIRFTSALRVGVERRARYFAAEGLAASTVRFDERAFVRKAQYMFGWDWGPRLISAGIWRPIELIQHAGRLLDVRVRQRHLPDGTVELAFTSEVDGEGLVYHFVEGFEQAVADGEVLRIERPDLWWPAGFGEQPLYTVDSFLVSERGQARAEIERAARDHRQQRVGLRTFQIVQTPDAKGASFEFEVNGRRLWAVGANWIPDSSFPARVSAQQVRAQIERARALNMNMLRIWGGGLYESEDFYDACDELGILVWQDFPYACSYYPDDEAAQAEARREARANVKRLRNRASLALYCGNNENLTMFQDKWDDAAKNPPRYYGEHLYDRVLPEVVAELDPDRPYIPSSPFGGERANSGAAGDQHYWDVWHGRGDWKYYEDSDARFSSEFGFASAPGSAAFRRLLGTSEALASVPVRDARARWHDKTKKGYETFLGYVALHYPAAQNLEEWMYYSQLNQRDALRHGIEHYRRSSFCRGSLIWQLNDCWPVQSWAVIDSAFELKAAAYELERLYAPALLSLALRERTLTVTAVLDNQAHAECGAVTVEARSLLDGGLLSRWSADIELAPDERRRVFELELDRFDARSTLLVASFAGRTTYRLLAEPKELELVEPRLSVKVSANELELTSDAPVVDLLLWDEAGELELGRNFVTLPSPGSLVLPLRRPARRLVARSLKGPHRVELTT